MRRIGRMILLLFYAMLIHGRGALPAATINKEKAQPINTVTQVRLGESSVELAGPWKFHTGDDMAWAQTEFDDSGWDTMDLTPPAGSADATLGTSGYVPGWDGARLRRSLWLCVVPVEGKCSGGQSQVGAEDALRAPMMPTRCMSTVSRSEHSATLPRIM